MENKGLIKGTLAVLLVLTGAAQAELPEALLNAFGTAEQRHQAAISASPEGKLGQVFQDIEQFAKTRRVYDQFSGPLTAQDQQVYDALKETLNQYLGEVNESALGLLKDVRSILTDSTATESTRAAVEFFFPLDPIALANKTSREKFTYPIRPGFARESSPGLTPYMVAMALDWERMFDTLIVMRVDPNTTPVPTRLTALQYAVSHPQGNPLTGKYVAKLLSIGGGFVEINKKSGWNKTALQMAEEAQTKYAAVDRDPIITRLKAAGATL